MFWFKKKPEKKYEYRNIPEDCILEFWTLYETFHESGSRADKYKLWTFIGKIIPETKDLERQSTIDTSITMRPRVALEIKD